MPAKSPSRTITRRQDWLGPAINQASCLWTSTRSRRAWGNSRTPSSSVGRSHRLTEIVLGKRGTTADTALRLGRFLKTSPQLWMRLQADWDLHQAMQREGRKAS